MKHVNKTAPLMRRTTIAFALLSALAGQAAIAAVSTNSAGPIHGRQIEIVGNPTLAGAGVVGTPMTVTVPATQDLDGDQLEDWKYVWKVDGVEVAAETDAGSATDIPLYTVRAQDAGKKLELCLRAVAEARSFPVSTRTSEQACSAEVDLILASLTIADPGTLSVAENDAYSLNLAVASNNNPNPVYNWEIEDGLDKALFAIDASTGQLTMAAKDFEAPTDSDANNTYLVKVKVTDTVSGATSSIELTVTVTNVVENATTVEVVDDAGVAVTGNPLVGTTLHTMVTLDDGQGAKQDRTDATYQWQRNGDAIGQPGWVDISGATGATYTVTAEDQGYEIRVDANGK